MILIIIKNNKYSQEKVYRFFDMTNIGFITDMNKECCTTKEVHLYWQTKKAFHN